jgi:PAS domain S-box-containing protein
MHKILIVEDEVIVARDIRHQLKLLNYNPVAATATGEEALLLTESLRPDLVLMDIQLAGDMDGIVAAQTIRERFDIPVVFLTAFAGDESVQRAKLAEPFGYIVKPLEECDLKITITIALYKHHNDKKLRIAHEQLLIKEERFNQLAMQSRTGVWEVNADGLYTYCSQVFSDLIGYPAEEIVGKKRFYDFHPEKGRDDFKRMALEAMARAEIIRDLENPIQNKAGRTIWVLTNGISVLNNSGEFQCYRGWDTDVTQRKQAEEQIRKLSSAVEQSPVSIVLTDSKGAIEYVNPKFTQVTGYTLEEVRGQNPRVLKGDKISADEYRRLWDCITHGQEWRGEFHNRKKNGGFFWESASISPIVDAHGHTTHYLAVKEDITDRKALEEQFRQAQKLEGIGQLAGGVAHDFNNILAVMMIRLGFLQKNKSLDQESLETVLDLMMDAKRSASMTKQLLLFSRRSVMEVEVLDLNELVSNLLKMVRRLIGEHVTVRFDPCQNLPSLEADTVMLEQVLMNLSLNARDAMPNGGSLTISIEPVQIDENRVEDNMKMRHGQFVCLSVADTGCGMDEGTLKHIFEPFFTTKEVGKGTGLGLATVHGIVAQHKGWVEVESELGKGTTFKVFLPATMQGRAEPTQTEKIAVIRGHETILLVEDETILRQLVAKGLRLQGYHVLEADNGQAAMKLWQEHSQQIDLLFSDMRMPNGMSGLDLAEKLRADKPNLKVIISSGYIVETAGHGKPTAGGIVYFHKPYEFEVLSKIVRDCLDRA